jgi:hypothetical protein
LQQCCFGVGKIYSKRIQQEDFGGGKAIHRLFRADVSKGSGELPNLASRMGVHNQGFHSI